jgi:uncharacterized protein involved in type VI secretion and phage assembly
MTTERVVAGLVDRVERHFFGKYRGIVKDNRDPKRLGRLRVQVPSVFGSQVVTGWALPCMPYGGAAGQGLLLVPDPGTEVWVEFEEGDLEFPIWVGTFWTAPGGRSELPTPNGPDGRPASDVQDPPTRKIFKTAKGHTLQFEDAGGAESVMLCDGKHGHVVVLDGDGIAISDGVKGNRVVMDGSGVVIEDANHNRITMSSSGIQIGGGAAEPMVLGSSLASALDGLVKALSTHTHPAPGGATGPPATPFSVKVALSDKQSVG